MNRCVRYFRSFQGRIVVALIVIALGCSWGLLALKNEANTRTDQFCNLIVSRHNDLVNRYNESAKFLTLPAGKEKNGLNTYIRNNLPVQKRVIIVERKAIPSVCFDKYDVKNIVAK